jgi:hypothetical protein
MRAIRKKKNQHHLSDKDQMTIEYLADATDCVQDAITTLTKLLRIGMGEEKTQNIIKNLSEIAHDLDGLRQKNHISLTSSANLAAYLSSNVFQCQPSSPN